MNAKTKPSKTKATAIGILGMHRSGTSLLTRIVNLLGAYIGEEDELMQSRPDNPEGFWEHQLVYDLHERLLEALRRSWDTAFPLPPDWHDEPDIAVFEDELVELIESRFSGQMLWAWKDPRTCVLLPLWKGALGKLGIQLRCLLVTRNPLDVARSLEARNGFSLDEGLGLWLNHNLAMLHNSEGMPRAIVSYQRFLADPRASIGKWAPHLSLPFQPDDQDVGDAIGQIVRTDLCHSASTLWDLSQAGCPEPVVELARILDAMEKTGNAEGPDDSAKIRSLLENHASLSKLYIHDFAREQKTNQQLHHRLMETEKLVADPDGTLKDQVARLAGLQSRLAEEEHQFSELMSQHASTEQQLQVRIREITDLRQQLKKTGRDIAAANAQIETHKQELSDASLQQETTERQLQARERELSAANAQIETHEQELNDAGMRQETTERQRQALERELSAATAQIESQEQALAEAKVRQETSDRQLQARERELVATQGLLKEHKQELAAARAHIDRITATYSWRLTTPFRRTAEFLQSVCRKLARAGRKLMYRNS